MTNFLYHVATLSEKQVEAIKVNKDIDQREQNLSKAVSSSQKVRNIDPSSGNKLVKHNMFKVLSELNAMQNEVVQSNLDEIISEEIEEDSDGVNLEVFITLDGSSQVVPDTYEGCNENIQRISREKKVQLAQTQDSRAKDDEGVTNRVKETSFKGFYSEGEEHENESEEDEEDGEISDNDILRQMHSQLAINKVDKLNTKDNRVGEVGITKSSLRSNLKNPNFHNV